MPQFLDLVSTFGYQAEDLDAKAFHFTSFNEERFLDEGAAKSHAIPRLGRSGRELRLCYNLWSVEPSAPWSIRQTAVYHSFDVENGRSLWVNIKGNEEMESRITEAVSSSSHLQAASLKTKKGSFAATLITHILIFEWSGENWQSLINHLEKQLRKLLTTAKAAPLKYVESALNVDMKVLLDQLIDEEGSHQGKSLSRANSAAVTGPFRRNTANSDWSLLGRVKSGFSRISTGTGVEVLKPAARTMSTPLSPPISPIIPTFSPFIRSGGKEPDGQSSQIPVHLLQDFKVTGLQTLTRIGEQLHEAHLVLKLNIDVLESILEYYQSLAANDEFPVEIAQEATTDLKYFERRVRGIIRGQRMEQYRIETLKKMLVDGKALVSRLNLILKKILSIRAYGKYYSSTLFFNFGTWRSTNYLLPMRTRVVKRWD